MFISGKFSNFHRSSLTGNIFDWATANWTVTHMIEKEISKTKFLCLKKINFQRLLAQHQEMTVYEGLRLCRQLGGEMHVPLNEEDLNLAKQKWTLKRARIGAWNGWQNQPDGSVIDMNGKGLVMNKDVFKRETWAPVNIEKPQEICGVLKRGQFLEEPCDGHFQVLCKMGFPDFKIRGLCKETKFDTDFSFISLREKGRRFHLAGASHSKMKWTGKLEDWKMWSEEDGNITATILNNTQAYPFGFRVWNFQNDVCQNGEQAEDGSYNTMISIDVCDEDQFNCMDGTW